MILFQNYDYWRDERSCETQSLIKIPVEEYHSLEVNGNSGFEKEAAWGAGEVRN